MLKPEVKPIIKAQKSGCGCGKNIQAAKQDSVKVQTLKERIRQRIKHSNVKFL